MSFFRENFKNKKINGITKKIISDNQQEIVTFSVQKECNDDELEKNYQLIIGKILNGRDTIIITKENQLMDLISGAVNRTDQYYLFENAFNIVSFTLKLEYCSHVKYHVTLVKKIPLSVVEDLTNSTEFLFGNLWFLILPNNADINQCDEYVINDIYKLSTYVNQLPLLNYEAVASPAMYDGLKILWFKPDKNIYQKEINSFEFEN